MTKQFLYKDEAGIRSNLDYVETVITAITPYFESYKALNLPVLTPQELEEFIKNPKAFFVKILSNGETLKIGQMELEPSKIYELFPVQEEIKTLVNDLESFQRQQNFSNYIFPLRYISVSENQLIINPEYVEKITSDFTYYTQTEEQNQALELMKRITEDLNTLKGLGKKPFFYYKRLMENCFKEKDTNAGNVIYENIKVVREF